MIEGEVHDAVGSRGGGAETVEVGELAAPHDGAGGFELGRRLSERARPTTSWPAPINSGTTAKPM